VTSFRFVVFEEGNDGAIQLLYTRKFYESVVTNWRYVQVTHQWISVQFAGTQGSRLRLSETKPVGKLGYYKFQKRD